MANGANDFAGGRRRRVGVVEDAIGGSERLVALAALFPNVNFEPVAAAAWADRGAQDFDIVIVAAEASSLEEIIRRLKQRRPNTRVAVVLRDADVVSTRLLVREGAADVLPAPASEPALALSLERILNSIAIPPEDQGKSGEVVAFIKAGGGVGATALAVQVAAMLSAGQAKVCLADMDLQFGVASLYLDLPDAVTIADLLNTRSNLADTPFDTALTAHRSGARLLAGPRELMPLETLSAAQIDSLLKGLRRNFRLTLIDLPSVWTAWTNRVLALADRIVLVTHLSVPHIQLVKRQLLVLATQKLDGVPLTLVCNSVSPEQQASVSIKAAEKALARSFDVVVPEDRKVMTAAVNQGLELSAVRRGTKTEKAILELADKVSGGAIAAPAARKGW